MSCLGSSGKTSISVLLVSSDAIFVGYSPAPKAYRYYDPNFKDVIISNNVKFNDNSFPCLKLPTILSEDSSGSLPSDIFFVSSAPGAYLPSPIASSSTNLYGPSSVAIHGEAISAIPSPRSLSAPVISI